MCMHVILQAFVKVKLVKELNLSGLLSSFNKCPILRIKTRINYLEGNKLYRKESNEIAWLCKAQEAAWRYDINA